MKERERYFRTPVQAEAWLALMEDLGWKLKNYTYYAEFNLWIISVVS